MTDSCWYVIVTRYTTAHHVSRLTKLYVFCDQMCNTHVDAENG